MSSLSPVNSELPQDAPLLEQDSSSAVPSEDQPRNSPPIQDGCPVAPPGVPVEGRTVPLRERKSKSFVGRPPGALMDISEQQVLDSHGCGPSPGGPPTRGLKEASPHRRRAAPPRRRVSAGEAKGPPAALLRHIEKRGGSKEKLGSSSEDSDSGDETSKMHRRLYALYREQEYLERLHRQRQQVLGRSEATDGAEETEKPLIQPPDYMLMPALQRRAMGRKRTGVDNAQMSLSEGGHDGEVSAGGGEVTDEVAVDASGSSGQGAVAGEVRVRRKSSGNRSSPGFGGLRRIPSSLFYIDYEDDADDDWDEESSSTDEDLLGAMPSSRRISAVQYNRWRVRDYDAISDVMGSGGVAVERGLDSRRALEGRGSLDVEAKAAVVAACYTDALKEIDVLMKPFRLSDDVYVEFMRLMGGALEAGLRRATNQTATVKMYPTYVRALPDGTENGRFMALDLGGTNFRILLVDLKGRDAPEVESKQFIIPHKLMLGPGHALFDHIVDCIAVFISERGLRTEPLALGFTFSFACMQEGPACARLVRWSKGFACAGVEGQDVVELLHAAIARRGDNLQLRCYCILNDNVGVLMTAARSDPNCLIGLILGTGTNCCYMEDLSNVELWDGDQDEPRQVIINTEWGAFGDDGSLESMRNHFDRQLDDESLKPGRHLFEKMISGMYMGELVHLVLCELANKGLLFEGKSSEELNEYQRFYTKYISEIESDDLAGDFKNTRSILDELCLTPVTDDDCRLVRHVCWQVSQRAAYLSAAGVAAVINRLSRNDITVAVDGSLYRFHPHFKDLMSKKISVLIRPWQQFKLTMAHDGSGQGAAIVAAVAKRQCDNKSVATDSSALNNNISVDRSDPKRTAVDNEAFLDSVFAEEKGFKSEKRENALGVGSTVECYY